MPPSVEELERRLRSRGDTNEEQIAMRMERAIWEMDQRNWYDHVVVNDVLEDCVNELAAIIGPENK
jgi:guanylate kinase